VDQNPKRCLGNHASTHRRHSLRGEAFGCWEESYGVLSTILSGPSIPNSRHFAQGGSGISGDEIPVSPSAPPVQITKMEEDDEDKDEATQEE
jgi:hypothetical protein